jgi:hypothetical protein
MRVQLGHRGGTNMKRYLQALQNAVGGATGVRVGFLENATYPPERAQRGPTLHVAQVAFFNEFGTSRAPARPFFRGMIHREQDSWGSKLGANLKAANYKSDVALEALGIDIKDALTNSIATWPADNAPSTVARKGFNHGLVDKGVMQRSTDLEVIRA